MANTDTHLSMLRRRCPPPQPSGAVLNARFLNRARPHIPCQYSTHVAHNRTLGWPGTLPNYCHPFILLSTGQNNASAGPDWLGM